MSAWIEIQGYLDDTGKKIDSWDARRSSGRHAGDYTERAEGARLRIKGILFELEAKADERDHLRKMLSEARSTITALELDVDRLNQRWDAALDERVAEVEKQLQADFNAARDELERELGDD